MSKNLRSVFPLLWLAVAACATAPAPGPAPDPAEPVRTDPERPARREAALQLGVVVSSSGSATLQQYGELVLEGARIGAESASTRRDVELVVRDDGGTAAGAARAVRELEAAGIRVIVGPLTEEALRSAAAARADAAVVLISPLATAEPEGAENVYALNMVDTRGAMALGEYARRYARVGVLYARTPDATPQARAFVDAYGRGGHGTVREAPFTPGATNVSAELRRLRDARVEAVYFPGSARELQVVLPQIDYFGLSGVQLLGNEAWAPDAAARLPQRVIEGAIIATPLLRTSPDVAWSEFVERYEQAYRRSVPNPVPALGYDAARLAVHAAAEDERELTAFRGATGVMSLRGGTITRKPFLVRIEAGRLVPVN